MSARQQPVNALAELETRLKFASSQALKAQVSPLMVIALLELIKLDVATRLHTAASKSQQEMPRILPARKRVRKLINAKLSPEQRRLAKKHGLPNEFARSVFECVPGEISMDEASRAIANYARAWKAAS